MEFVLSGPAVPPSSFSETNVLRLTQHMLNVCFVPANARQRLRQPMLMTCRSSRAVVFVPARAIRPCPDSYSRLNPFPAHMAVAQSNAHRSTSQAKERHQESLTASRDVRNFFRNSDFH